MASAQIAIPTPPASLPAEVQEQWRELYLAGYKDSQERHPNLQPDRAAFMAHHQEGLKQANRLVRVEMPENYEQAMALKPWQLLPGWPKVVPANVTGRGDELRGVTIDGKKFSFHVPKSK